MTRTRKNASLLENFPYLTKWMMPNANYFFVKDILANTIIIFFLWEL